MKTFLSLLLLLPNVFAFGQYSTKTVAQNRHLKVELRYKTQIAFNEADENLFSLIFTNKTKLPLKIQGVS